MSGLTDSAMRKQLLGGVTPNPSLIRSGNRGMSIHVNPKGPVPTKNSSRDLRFVDRHVRPSCVYPDEWRDTRRKRRRKKS